MIESCLNIRRWPEAITVTQGYAIGMGEREQRRYVYVGTCRLVDNDSGPNMHCTACGGQVDDEYPYFAEEYGYTRCPHCGRRIVEWQ